jgi:hypothetical protein
VVVRCTKKLLDLLGRPGLIKAEEDEDDWYANLLWFDRRKCLLLTHAGTPFSVFVGDVRRRDLEPPGPPLVRAITNAIRYEFPLGVLGPLDPGAVKLARTASRRGLGHMNELAVECGWAIDAAGGLRAVDLDRLNHDLRRHLHNLDGTYSEPLDLVVRRLDAL